jgi:hypothetical protein
MGQAGHSLTHDESRDATAANDAPIVSLPTDPPASSIDRPAGAESEAGGLISTGVEETPAANRPRGTPTVLDLAINMSGAISAGAYTAGVLDFLIEALEEWQKQKDEFHAQLKAGNAEIANPVPLHEVKIRAFTGASAGGMCAAIAATMLQSDFQHIHTGNEGTGGEPPTNNTFYESWVNQIDIKPLLGSRDIKGGKPLTSLLDCTVIDEIAERAIQLGALKPKPFIAPDLSLFLMLTNVRGVSYPLYADASMALEEYVPYYGDKLHFQMAPGARSAAIPGAKPLPLTSAEVAYWPLLREAAKATGAFPVFLAPRKLTRSVDDYSFPLWNRLTDPEPKPPIVPESPKTPPPTWETLNIDGGLIDNDPLELASDFLAMNNLQATFLQDRLRNPREANKANSCVLSISPFPVVERFKEDYFTPPHGTAPPDCVFSTLGKILPLLLSQSRFFGESLADAMSGISFDHFVIAPSDPSRSGQNALQSSALGAFGGFLDRRFRKHDFLLGRRNCQRFLQTRFALPLENPVIDAGMSQAGPWANPIQSRFVIGTPTDKIGTPFEAWIPIIPLCGEAEAEVPEPDREKITDADLDKVVDLAFDRFRGIRSQLLADAPGFVKFVAAVATWPIIRHELKSALKEDLRKALGDNIQ